MEKNCENCNDKALHRCGPNQTKICGDWQPDYQALESQLAKSNELIQDQIREICGLRETLQKYENYKYEVGSGTPLEIAHQALSRPAPVDEEKEVLKQFKEKAYEYFTNYHLSWCGAADCGECLIDDCALRELGLLIYGYEQNQAQSKSEAEVKR